MGFPAKRMVLSDVAPDAYRAMLRLDGDARKLGVEQSLLELVRYRASLLNKCAFCIDMHAKDARAAGESEERLHLLAAWHEATCYTERERAALALTDAMTMLVTGDVGDEVYAQAQQHFTEPELAGLIWAITVINAWNRIGVTTRMEPGHYQPS